MCAMLTAIFIYVSSIITSIALKRTRKFHFVQHHRMCTPWLSRAVTKQIQAEIARSPPYVKLRHVKGPLVMQEKLCLQREGEVVN